MITPPKTTARCALCGATGQALIGSAGFLGTATDARICRDGIACASRRPFDPAALFR